MLPEKTEFLKKMAAVYDAMKANRKRKTCLFVYDGTVPHERLPTLLLRSRFAFKLTTDPIHIELLKAEREADRLKL